MEACFEGMTCSICGSEIEEHEDYKWSDTEEDYICMNCAEDEDEEDDDENEDDEDGWSYEDWDDEDDECDDEDDDEDGEWRDDDGMCDDMCDRCGKPAICKEVWGKA